MKKLLGLIIFFLAGAALAQGTPPVLLTVLSGAHKGPSDTRQLAAMARGFGHCDPVAALPKGVLRPLGVKYRSRSLRDEAAYPELIESVADALLVGNDVSAMEKEASGKYLNYGATYALKVGVLMGDNLQIIRVGSFTGITPPRLVVGVTYGFNQPVLAAIKEIDLRFGTGIEGRINAEVKPETAKTSDVWFTVDEAQRSVTCWRFPHSRILE